MAHWKMDCDADGYVWLTIDVADKSVNVLTHEVLEELDQLVSNLSKQEDIKGLALLSGKSGGFVYGADVRQFELLKDAETVSDHINAVHHTMNKQAERLLSTAIRSLPRAVRLAGQCCRSRTSTDMQLPDSHRHRHRELPGQQWWRLDGIGSPHGTIRWLHEALVIIVRSVPRVHCVAAADARRRRAGRRTAHDRAP